MSEVPPSEAAHEVDWPVADQAWVNIQKKTFSKWTNSHLVKHGLKVDYNTLEDDLENGIILMNLMNILYSTPIPKHNANPKMRVNKLDNISLALKMVEDSGVKLHFVKNTHLVDKELKMLLGMIWTIILDYQIKGISVEEMSAKEGLLLWCQKKTKGYKNVKVENFHNSWVDGLGFAALIHRHRPDLLDFDSLSKDNAKENLELAFSIAEEKLGIPRLLDVEDLTDVARPDERSVMTYVSEFFHKFAQQDQKEVAARRIQKFVLFSQNIQRRESDYEQGSRDLLNWINAQTDRLRNRDFESSDSAESARALFEQHKNFANVEKTEKSVNKMDLESDYTEIQTTLQKNNRHLFTPDESITPEAIDRAWNALADAERDYATALRLHVFKFITKKVDEASTEQLKEFEDTFKHFDKNNDDFLDRLEFKACLSALGIPFRDEKAYEEVFFKVSGGGEGINLEQFIKYMKDLTTDRDTPDQIKNSFKILADDRPTISTHELKVHPLEQSDVDFLAQHMGPFQSGHSYDYSSFTDSVFTVQ